MRRRTLTPSLLFIVRLLATGSWLAIPSVALTQPAPKKLALLVGIDRYQAVSDLEGCANDAHAMQTVLVGKFDFPPENVTVLTDEAATREGILRTFRTVLIDRAAQGDIVVFHYSGHGSRMGDASRDEIDGWDETLVPQDSRTPGVFDISDDELNGLLGELSQRTANVTVILDSCHSGSGARAVGARPRQVPDDLRPPPSPSTFAWGARSGAEGPSDFRPDGASWALISGCRAHELSNEYSADGRWQGALTYFLTRALAGSGAETTYRDVMDAVETEVSAAFPSQHPQLEGARADAWVFGDGTSLAEPYVLASPGDGDRVELQAGAVYGLRRGSRVEIYPPQTKSFAPPARAVAMVELTGVEAFRSEGLVVQGGPIVPLSRAVLREGVFGQNRLQVYFHERGRSSALQAVAAALADYPALEVVEESAAARVLVTERDGQVVLVASDQTEISSPVPLTDPRMTARVVEQLNQWARWFRVLALVNPSSPLAVGLRVGFPGSAGATPSNLGVTHGQQVEVEVKNLSQTPLYVTLLDLARDGSVTVLYAAGEAEQLLPGKNFVSKIEMFVPEGRTTIDDVIKALFTTIPIRAAVFAQGAIRRGVPPVTQSDPLASFLENSVLGTSRNARVKLDGWATADQHLTVRRGDRRLESYVLHLAEGSGTNLRTRVADARDLCPEDPSSTAEPCLELRPFAPGASALELVPAGRRGASEDETSFGAAWDEAYRLRRESGAERVEPLFEVDLSAWDAEINPYSRSSGGRPDKPGAKADPTWSLKQVAAPAAWQMVQARGRENGEEGRSVTVAHLDTGYRRHPEYWHVNEVQSHVLFSKGYDFLESDDDAFDTLDTSGLFPNPGHGTKSGSVIVSAKGKQWSGGGPGELVDGVAPGTRLVPLRVHRSVVHLSSQRLAKAIHEAASDDRTRVKQKSQVIAISMGGTPSWALWKAVRYAEQRGVIVVAAAGNEVGTVVWPARFRETVAVAATNVECGTWDGSSRGPAVDIAAPGESVWHAETAADGKDSIRMGQGTTYATATTAGVAALWLDYHRDDPALEQLRRAGRLTRTFREVLQSTAWRPGTGAAPPGVTCAAQPAWNVRAFGAGIVHAAQALAAPLPTVTASLTADSRGLSDLPLFASLFVPETPDAVVRHRYGRLLRAESSAELEQAGELESEVVFHYALGEEVRAALDELVVAEEPAEPSYQRARQALLASDVSQRLRRELRRAP